MSKLIYGITNTGLSSFTNNVVSSGSLNEISTIATNTSPDTIYTLGAVGQNMAVNGKYTYIAFGSTGQFQILDNSNPLTPTSLSLTSTVGGSPKQLLIKGTVLFIADVNLEVWDVSNPSAPTNITVFTLTNPDTIIKIEGNLLYGMNTTGGDTSLDIINIVTPGSPTSLYSAVIVPGQTLHSFVVKNSFIYASLGSLYIIDATISATPVVQNHIAATSSAYIQIQGIYLYSPIQTGPSTGSIITYDISSNPPTVKQTLTGTQIPTAFALGDKYAYISSHTTTNTNTFKIYDISVPGGMVFVSQSGTVTKPSEQILLYGTYLYHLYGQTSPNQLYVYALQTAAIGQLAADKINVSTLNVLSPLNAYGGFVASADSQIYGKLTSDRLNLSTYSTAAQAWANNTASAATGVQSNFNAATYTDTTSPDTSTVSFNFANTIGVPTFSSVNNVDYTTAATLYIDGPPTAGANSTIDNPYSLYIGAGNNFVAGDMNSAASLSTGVISSITGLLNFYNSGTANTLTIQAGATANPCTFTLPTDVPASTMFLQSDHTGVLSFASVGASTVLTSTVTLAPSDIVLLATTPFQLVPAQGAGTFIVFHKLSYYNNFNTAAYTGGGATTVIQYDSTASAGGIVEAQFVSSAITTAASLLGSVNSGTTGIQSSIANMSNQGIYLSSSVNFVNPGTAAGTFEVITFYSVFTY